MKTIHNTADYPKEIHRYLESVQFESARIVFCERFDEKSHIWNFNQHKHPYTEFIYILDGNMQINMPDRKLFKRPYNLVVYPKNVMHREIINIQEHQQIICVGIATDESCEINTAIEIDDSDGVFRRILGQIYAEHELPENDDNEEIIRHYIALLYLHMVRYYKDDNKKDQDFINRCICYIHDHFLDDITIGQLSAIAFVSPSHLTRTFRQRTGYSPLAYVRAYRLDTAKHALASSNNSIEKIALMAGFRDAKYFSRFFKEEMGMTPREWRRKEATGYSRETEETTDQTSECV